MKSVKYYEAYDLRYKTVHDMGYRWSGNDRTPIVYETIEKYSISREEPILEIGCGEGTDAVYLLEKGYDVKATDVSPEAIEYCKKTAKKFKDRFWVMDCLENGDESLYGFIYSVSVIHMLLTDSDRNAFFRFISGHLKSGGTGLICAMGDGKTEIKTDINEAFELKEREHPSGKMKVAATSLRMVGFDKFESEILNNGLEIIEKGFTSRMPDFDSLMWAVVRKA